MGVPIGFEPDFDTTPDADLLGYGWLHYDDGTDPRWLNGDAETAALVGRYQDHVQGSTAPAAPTDPSSTPATTPPDRGATVGSMLGDAANSLLGKPNDPSRFSNYSNQNLFGGFSTAAAPDGAPDPTTPSSPEMQAGAVPQPGAAPAPTPPSQVDMTGQSVSNPSPLPPPPMAPPGPPMSPDGLQLFERQGKLDPDVAARQASDRTAENQRLNDATQKSRDDAFRIQHDSFFAEAGRQSAIADAQQKQAQDAQDRVTRYQSEQQLVNDAQIHHDLVSAQGPGAILTVVGAALLGATGSQAGLQMINQTIDRYVKTQLQQKDSKLRILADQIGSDRQVAAMATSRYLEASQKHADMLQKLAGADAFNAQTPLIMEGMKATQQQADQVAEKESLGKSTEKAPPAMKGVDPKMVQKLGTERRTRQGIENILGSAEKAIGLVWDPKLQDYTNGDEKIKAGFQGSGALEHLVPDAFYSVFGDTTAEGYRVTGAARALAYAKSQQLQPGSKITKEDVEDGVKAMGLDTERGFVNGLRQMRVDLGRSRAVDVGQYGPDVVNQFERNYRAGGGMDQTSSPGAAAPASLDTKQAALDQLRTGKAMAQEGGQHEPSQQTAAATDSDLAPIHMMLGQRYELNPDPIANIIQHESGGKAGAMNHAGGGSHGGLIGFDKGNWPAVAKAAGHPEVKFDEAMKLPADQQLEYVYAYYKMHGLSEHSAPEDYALATALPWAIGKPPDEVVGEKGSTKKIGNLTAGQIWEANPPWRGSDGKITPASILSFYGY